MATIKYNSDGITIDGENIATEDYVDSVASGMTVIVSNSTANTSTLPTLSVPALTGANIDAIISAFSNGKGVMIKTTSADGTITHGYFTVEEVDLGNNAVDIAWYDYYLTYEKNGTGNATVTYTSIGGTAGTRVSAQTSFDSTYSNTTYGLSINDTKYGLVPQKMTTSSGIAMGPYATCSSNAVAIGYSAGDTSTNKTHFVAIGHQAKVTTNDSIAIGASAVGRGVGSIVIGENACSSTTEANTYSIGIGYGVKARSINAVVIGKEAETTSAETTSIGQGTGGYIPGTINFDSRYTNSSYQNRTIVLKSTDNIFFRNEDVDTSKATYGAYTNGKTLTQVLSGLGDGTSGSDKLYRHDIECWGDDDEQYFMLSFISNSPNRVVTEARGKILSHKDEAGTYIKPLSFEDENESVHCFCDVDYRFVYGRNYGMLASNSDSHYGIFGKKVMELLVWFIGMQISLLMLSVVNILTVLVMILQKLAISNIFNFKGEQL